MFDFEETCYQEINKCNMEGTHKVDGDFLIVLVSPQL